MFKRVLSVLLIVTVFISGCAAKTSFTSAQTETTLNVKTGQTTNLPREEEFNTTSFGNYEFVAEHPDYEPLYGILPLKFNGGYMALDILFFAPALFFNLREVFPYYEFDMEKKVVQFKKEENDPWQTYTPLDVEEARAKRFFHKQ